MGKKTRRMKSEKKGSGHGELTPFVAIKATPGGKFLLRIILDRYQDPFYMFSKYPCPLFTTSHEKP